MLDDSHQDLRTLMLKFQLWTKHAANSAGVNREKALKHQKSYKDRISALVNGPSDRPEVAPVNCFLCILMEQQVADMAELWQFATTPNLDEVVAGLKSMGTPTPVLAEEFLRPPLCSKCSDLMSKILIASDVISNSP
jgi:hypothetical protein